MLFNSWIFWVFLPLVLVGYHMLGRRSQNVCILLASYVFYGWWDSRFLGLILLSTLVDYAAALALDRRRLTTVPGPGGTARDAAPFRFGPGVRRAFLIASLATNLGILGFFKYFNFFEENLHLLLRNLFGGDFEATGLNVILPIGVSFYTFQTMSYTIDVYRGHLRATSHFIEFAAFVAFFPQLVAGPIVRAAHLLPQIAAPRARSARQAGEGGYLILWGLFKKVVIADNLAPLVDQVFATPAPGLDAALVLLGVYGFAVQIYCDFSGYTDIARGSAKLLGFEFDLNFDLPYVAKNPSDFWRRWHISLSSWLRDYLYVSLGGNRARPWRVYANLMTTMLLGGLWHGASWTFVAWGFYQGLLLVSYRWAGPRLLALPGVQQLARYPLVAFARWVFFFHLVCLGWLLFRAQSFQQVLDMLRTFAPARFSAPPHPDMLRTLIFFSAPLVAMQIVQWRTRDLNWILRLSAPLRGLAYAVIFIGIVLLGCFETNEFIYFQF